MGVQNTLKGNPRAQQYMVNTKQTQKLKQEKKRFSINQEFSKDRTHSLAPIKLLHRYLKSVAKSFSTVLRMPQWKALSVNLSVYVYKSSEWDLVPQHSSALNDLILSNLALSQMTNPFPGESSTKSEILESIKNST